METYLFDRKFEQYNLYNKAGLAALVLHQASRYSLLACAHPKTAYRPLHFLILPDRLTDQQTAH